jgi:hypothetical protein
MLFIALGLILGTVTVMEAPSLLHPGEAGLFGTFDGTEGQGRRSVGSFALMSLALVAFGLWNMRSGRARLHLYFTAGLAFSAFALFSQTWGPEADRGPGEYLVKIASDLNQTTPHMIDPETRLDRALAAGNTLSLNITMVNFTRKDLDGHESQLESELRKQICVSPLAKNVLGKGASLQYHYNGKDGRRLSDVFVTEALCR